MPIRLRIERRSAITLDEESITLGSDPTCTVPLPECDGLLPRHAAIRKIAGRWIVEARDADTIRIGDGEPTRVHWLTPGDVIRLSDDCPAITFEQSSADAKSTSPEGSAAPPTTAGFVRPKLRSESTPRESSPEPPLPPPPAVKKPSAPPPSSDNEPDTLQLSKPRSIVVPPFQNPVELHEQRPSPPAAKPVKPPRKPEPPASKLSPPPLPASTPKPTSWIGGAGPGPGSQSAAAELRRRRAQRRFWMQVGGVGILCGVAFAVWHFGASPSNAPTPAPETIGAEQTSHDPASRNQGTDTTVPAAAASSSTIPPANVTPPKETARVDEPKSLSSTSREKASTDDPAMTETSLAGASPKRESSNEKTSKPSATMTAVRDGVFAVHATHSDQEHCFRVGTAWAASRRHLVTSGAVAMAVEDLQRQGLSIVVSQPANERPVLIKSIQVNPAYKSAVEKASVARQQLASDSPRPTRKNDDADPPPDVALARAYTDQARFDLGLLEVATGERLRSPLNMESTWVPEVGSFAYAMIGFPVPPDEFRSTSATTTDEPTERASPASGTHKSEKDLSLTMEFPKDVEQHNWSGSPVFDRSRRVIGIYSRSAKPSKDASIPTQHAIIWLGRLREFAPELEN